MIKIKFCGLKREEDISFANETKPDYIGFVFYEKSKRFVNFENASNLKNQLDCNIKAVGVFVDEDVNIVAELLNKNVIDIAQLHGKENEEYIKNLRSLSNKPIIKAFNIVTANDIEAANKSSADFILLDSATAGSGKTFDYKLLNGINRNFFLAGGLNPENILETVKTVMPYGVDLSSGIETNGIKDLTKMRSIIEILRERK